MTCFFWVNFGARIKFDFGGLFKGGIGIGVGGHINTKLNPVIGLNG